MSLLVSYSSLFRLPPLSIPTKGKGTIFQPPRCLNSPGCTGRRKKAAGLFNEGVVTGGKGRQEAADNIGFLSEVPGTLFFKAVECV